MKDINCDIAFMCLGQTYTMNTVEDAANAVLDVNAKVAIPFHYGTYEGTKNDALKFKEILTDKVADSYRSLVHTLVVPAHRSASAHRCERKCMSVSCFCP